MRNEIFNIGDEVYLLHFGYMRMGTVTRVLDKLSHNGEKLYDIKINEAFSAIRRPSEIVHVNYHPTASAYRMTAEKDAGIEEINTIILSENKVNNKVCAISMTSPGPITSMKTTISIKPGEYIIDNAKINCSDEATCSKKDTYDFEIGALIALMKMCDKDKVKKAINEVYGAIPGSFESAINEFANACKKLTKLREMNDNNPKTTFREQFWKSVLYYDTDNPYHWVRVPIWAFKEFCEEIRKRNTFIDEFKYEDQILYTASVCGRKYIYLKVYTNGMQYTLGEPSCDEYFIYTPILNVKMFKRNKYAISVCRNTWDDFRTWCISAVGVDPYLVPKKFPWWYCPDDQTKPIVLRYEKGLQDIGYNFDEKEYDVYDWEDLQ